ncbi:MAG: hypothetical protein ACMG6H_10885 [Acidobacteriota bacterium]
MTKEELVKEFWQLPPVEREAVAEEILKGVREETKSNGSTNDRPANYHSLDEKLAAFYRLEGMFKTDAPPPTDEELKEDYINYLAEKYS